MFLVICYSSFLLTLITPTDTSQYSSTGLLDIGLLPAHKVPLCELGKKFCKKPSYKHPHL